MTHEAHQKVQPSHLKRNAYLYVRQSTLRQVIENTESTQRQYALKQHAAALGWPLERIIVIDTDLGQSITLGASDGVYGTARFDTPGHLIASVNASERIEFWNAETGKLVRALCCMALYGDLAFSPNGRLLAAAGHWPRLWDLTTGRELRRLVKTRNPTFAAVSFRPDGRVLATGSQDGKTRLWEVATGLELTSGQTRQNYIESVAFHPRGQLLAYGVRDGAVWLWDTTTGTEQLLVAAATSNVAFSSDGRWLSFGGPGGTVHLWNVSEGREVPALAFPIN